eukprot:TRINITY_DN3301_c5_g1_i1.p1 TRINITY_DN3301_c5_g1~~TRINITY_DN3301_c5_g1_i1.p1  ORF type:complete len:415 (+),score=79.58 TRINITY_DN3301_c5_g1_i1:51-1247(+)
MSAVPMVVMTTLAGKLPDFNWNHVPTYSFCSPANYTWRKDEIDWMKGLGENPAPFFNIMGYATYVNMAPTNQHAEEKQIAAAKELRDNGVNITLLAGTGWDLVFKTLMDVDVYMEQHPETMLHCNGTLQLRPDGRHVHDWSNPTTRGLWAGLFSHYIDTGYFDGAFLDGIGPELPPYDPNETGYNIISNPNCSQAEKNAWIVGQQLMINQLRDAVGVDNLTMCNGHLQVFATHTNIDIGDTWCNGNFQEEWQGRLEDVQVLLKAGQYENYPVAVRSVGDNTTQWMGPFNVSLAAFLGCAKKYHYFLHFFSYDCGEGPGLQTTKYPEYSKPLGEPLQDPIPLEQCTSSSCILRRSFTENVHVLYNYTNGKSFSCIRWGDHSVTEFNGGCAYLPPAEDSL